MIKPKKEDLKAIYNKITEPKIQELKIMFDKKGKPKVALAKVNRIPPIRRKRTPKKRK
jgi:hypothetical protein